MNYLPPKLANIFVMATILASGLVKADETEKQKQPALSEEFLLFLADMEEVDGEYVHPVDLSDAQSTSSLSVEEQGAINETQDKAYNDTDDKRHDNAHNKIKNNNKKVTAPKGINDEN